MVTGPVYGTQSASCAYQFASMLLIDSPHTINTIFFYSDGVYNANRYTDPANDEFDLVRGWQQLAKKYFVKLAVCTAAAQRRGIVSKNVADYFDLVGLGELSESVAMSDRVIQF